MSLAISLYGEDLQVIAERLEYLAQHYLVAELRLDRIPEQLDLAALNAARGDLKLILACVPESEGGTFAGSANQWALRMRNAAGELGGPLFLDVPPCFSDAPDLPNEHARIWSWHQSAGSDVSKEELHQIHEQLSQLANLKRGDTVKIVAWADRHADSLNVLPLYTQKGPPLVAFAQGPGGQASRLWALSLGAPWTYACWNGEATAPGQWSEHEVKKRSAWQGVNLFGVMGDPISHSRSPLLWQVAFNWLEAKWNAAGSHSLPSICQEWSNGLYLPLQHDQLNADLLRGAYGSKEFQAFSVTAPLKTQALQSADIGSIAAQSIGAANYLLRVQGLWVAHNTDGAGALDPLQEAGLEPGLPLLILGAGGAARAVVFEALSRGYQITIAARQIEAAQALVDDMLVALPKSKVPPLIQVADLADPELFSKFIEGDLEPSMDAPQFGVIQATPLGSKHRPGNPLGQTPFPAGGIALDMVYDPPNTEFLTAVQRGGSVGLSGHHMLLAQMLQQFALGTGEAPPRKLLQLALENDLGLPCKPILLVGPRASGKSTLGKMLAEVIGFRFLDADQELEALHQRKIATWIQEDEPGFRLAEAELLKKLVLKQGTVVALGGGVIENSDSLELLASQPGVLGLQLSPEEQLARRTVDDRPALTELSLPAEIRALDEHRAPLYQKACSSRQINVHGILSTSFLSLLQSINLIG